MLEEIVRFFVSIFIVGMSVLIGMFIEYDILTSNVDDIHEPYRYEYRQDVDNYRQYVQWEFKENEDA